MDPTKEMMLMNFGYEYTEIEFKNKKKVLYQSEVFNEELNDVSSIIIKRAGNTASLEIEYDNTRSISTSISNIKKITILD